MSKVSVQGDPYWAQAASNIAGLFDPKAQAEGGALQARTRNFDAEAKYNDARTGLIGDRRKALDPVALAAAGYTPRQVAAITATQTDRMSDLFSGVRIDAGTQELLRSGGDPRTAGILLNFAKAGDKDFAATDARANELNAQIAKNAESLQLLKNSGALDISMRKPLEVSAGASVLFPPGDPRNPASGSATPSQLFTAPPLPGRVSSDGLTTGAGRTGNLSADETEILNRIKLEEAGGKSLAAMAQYPITGGAAISDLVTASAIAAYPTDTPSVAISKWMAANGVSIDNDWNAFSSNKSDLMKDGKPLAIADLIRAASVKPAVSAPLIKPASPPTPARTYIPGLGMPPYAPAPAAGVAPTGGQPVIPAAQVPAAATQAGGPQKTANGGVVIDGVPFEPSHTLASERQHGDQYTGINAKTGNLETRYWDANTATWSKNPVFTGNEDDPDVSRIKNEDTFLGVIPNDAKAFNAAPAILIDKGRKAGFIDEAKLATAIAADRKVEKNSYRRGDNVTNYLRTLAPRFNALNRSEIMKDPRVAKFASGDFSGDAGLPDEAMALAERMGMNRKQFGIPDAGLGEGLPLGLGAVFAPAGYGEASDTMPRGLQAFFRAVREGRFDPEKLTVRPPEAKSIAARK